MHKQNYFQLPPTNIAPPDYDYFVVMSDIANALEPANDARHWLQHLASEIYLAG